MCVNNLSKVALDSAVAGILTTGRCNVSAPSYFIANSHNELYTFYREKATYWRKNSEEMGVGRQSAL